jgi:hypothetical protein
VGMEGGGALTTPGQKCGTVVLCGKVVLEPVWKVVLCLEGTRSSGVCVRIGGGVCVEWGGRPLHHLIFSRL